MPWQSAQNWRNKTLAMAFHRRSYLLEISSAILLLKKTATFGLFKYALTSSGVNDFAFAKVLSEGEKNVFFLETAG
ncbi:hypothetical protein [Reinekea sp. G2M2-21]|uniref:hypothetical protein n=1 Tax=Reinekea sp. G2M2-21 TaxID=2788942 RepID=UPI0018AA37AB|nr:hypothetical protein [Reinekea sp. G2M2-21]